MPNTRSAIPLLNTDSDLARVGDYVRWARASARMTRRQFGAAIYAREAAVEKWERHERNPTAEAIERILRYVPESRIIADALIAVATPEFHPATTASAAGVTDDDRDHLENMRGPAALLWAPYHDVMAVNREWAQRLPGLDPGPDPGSVNFIEYLLGDPARTIENRLDLAHGLLFELRMMRPFTDPDHFTAVVEGCRNAPDFDRLWRTDPPPRVIDDSAIAIWNAVEGRNIGYRVRRSHRAHMPPGPSTIVYSLYRPGLRSGHRTRHRRHLHSCPAPEHHAVSA